MKEKNELKGLYLKNLFDEIYSSTSKIHEDVIPMNIHIKSTKLEELKKQFPKITFNNINNTNELNGKIKNKKIIINYSIKNTCTELEAIIGHELIHLEQLKRSKGKWLEQTKNTVQKINLKIKNIKSSYDEKEIIQLLKDFNFLTPEEKMSYAYQLVKINNGNIHDIMKHIKNDTLFSIYNKDKRFLKYVYMYLSIYKNI